jgi:hypothetical protein
LFLDYLFHAAFLCSIHPFLLPVSSFFSPLSQFPFFPLLYLSTLLSNEIILHLALSLALFFCTVDICAFQFAQCELGRYFKALIFYLSTLLSNKIILHLALSLALFLALWIFMHFNSPNVNWVDISQALIFHLSTLLSNKIILHLALSLALFLAMWILFHRLLFFIFLLPSNKIIINNNIP